MAPSKEKEVLDLLLEMHKSLNTIRENSTGIIPVCMNDPKDIISSQVLPGLGIEDSELEVILNNLYAKRFITKFEPYPDKYNGKVYSIDFPSDFAFLYKKYSEIEKHKKISLDKKLGRLSINNIEIQFSLRSQSYQLDLLKTLFKNINKLWSNDEIMEDWGVTEDDEKRFPKKRIYQAGKAINEKVSTSIHCKEPFLIVTTNNLKFNPEFQT